MCADVEADMPTTTATDYDGEDVAGYDGDADADCYNTIAGDTLIGGAADAADEATTDNTCYHYDTPLLQPHYYHCCRG